MRRIGIALGGRLAHLPSLARAAEQRGVDSVWASETTSSAFVQAALLAAATRRVRVGTGIALAFPRSPTITAQSAADLDELSEGRFVLGLGPQVKAVSELRFSVPFEHPAPKMREYVQAVRAVLGGYFGEAPDHRGEHYRITLAPWPRPAGLPRRHIPIFLAAVNEGMARVAGAVADGMIGHPMSTPRYVEEVVLPNLSRGMRRAGRTPGHVELAQMVMVSVAPDPALARLEAKQQIGFYATTRTYRPVLALHGFEEAIPRLRAAFASGDMNTVAEEVSDEMLETFAAMGSHEEIRRRLLTYAELADEVIITVPWYAIDANRLEERYAALLDLLDGSMPYGGGSRSGHGG
ncbi:MAG: TIGR03617 family F420-dependent LLM class oxidoreductase [Actinomycetota bacterium]